jgi:hypothetical protein
MIPSSKSPSKQIVVATAAGLCAGTVSAGAMTFFATGLALPARLFLSTLAVLVFTAGMFGLALFLNKGIIEEQKKEAFEEMMRSAKVAKTKGAHTGTEENDAGGPKAA